MTPSRLLAAAALASSVAVPLAVAPPATALSCVAAADVLADAPQVYAGRIIDGGDGRILVEVTEVWKGAPVEEEVWLRVEAEGWTSWSGSGGKIPDGFSSPATWVLAPLEPGTIGPCSAWPLDREMRQHLLPFRPDQPASPVAEDAHQDTGEAAPVVVAARTSVWPLVGWAGGASGLLLVALAYVVRRRRSIA